MKSKYKFVKEICLDNFTKVTYYPVRDCLWIDVAIRCGKVGIKK